MTTSINNYNLNFSRGSIRAQLEKLKVERPPEWQRLALKLIRQARFDDPNLEIHRLRSFGVLNASLEARLEKAIQEISCTYSIPRNVSEAKAMMGRAIEIKNIYGSTHDVFVHAQSSSWLPYVDLEKELIKIHHPKKDLHQFKLLRSPFLAREARNISEYANNPNANDSTDKGMEDLISADSYFLNNEYQESAIYFLLNNMNILSGFRIQKSLSSKSIQAYYPGISKDRIDTFAEQIVQAEEETSFKTSNLVVFCIPKEKSDKIQYRAHAFGKPCQCHRTADREKVLDSLQNEDLHTKSECLPSNEWPTQKPPPPQARLFTPKLTKENGVLSFLISPNQAMRKKVKKEVKRIVHEMHKTLSPS